MRPLLGCATVSAITGFGAVMALSADTATVAIAATATLIALGGVIGSWGGDEGLTVANPILAGCLALAGRYPWPMVLPTAAAHVIGAFAGGLAARGLAESVGTALLWSEPRTALIIVTGTVAGLMTAVGGAACDSGRSPAWLAGAPLVSGAMGGVVLTCCANPAALIAMTLAGFLTLGETAIASGAVIGGAIVGVFLIRSWVEIN